LKIALSRIRDNSIELVIGGRISKLRRTAQNSGSGNHPVDSCKPFFRLWQESDLISEFLLCESGQILRLQKSGKYRRRADTAAQPLSGNRR
jgi:hypothetical protein